VFAGLAVEIPAELLTSGRRHLPWVIGGFALGLIAMLTIRTVMERQAHGQGGATSLGATIIADVTVDGPDGAGDRPRQPDRDRVRRVPGARDVPSRHHRCRRLQRGKNWAGGRRSALPPGLASALCLEGSPAVSSGPRRKRSERGCSPSAGSRSLTW
jgi:hypothetical protein